VPRDALDYIDDSLTFFFATDLFQGKIEEATDIFRTNLEDFETFTIAFGQEFTNTYEIILQSGRRVISILDVALCHALYDLSKGLGYIHPFRSDRRYALADNVLHNIQRCGAIKRRSAAEHRVEQYAETVDIGSGIWLSRHPPRLLRSDECKLQLDADFAAQGVPPSRGEAIFERPSSAAKIDHLDTCGCEVECIAPQLTVHNLMAMVQYLQAFCGANRKIQEG
jgi:hypothetical protein